MQRKKDEVANRNADDQSADDKGRALQKSAATLQCNFIHHRALLLRHHKTLIYMLNLQSSPVIASYTEESGGNRLASSIRNKQRILEARLGKLGTWPLEKRFQELQTVPVSVHQLLRCIVQNTKEGRTTVIAEVARLSPAESMESLTSRCRDYASWGADALALYTDEEVSPNGVLDLAAVCKVVKVPVIRKDWILHPIQIVDTREAGAAALTVVHTVLHKGTPLILQYAAELGLDAIVEVVNLKELEELSTVGIPMFGFNISVGLSVSIPGVRQDIAKSLVRNTPFGAASIVGVKSIEEASEMKLCGADAIFVKREVLQGLTAVEASHINPQTLLQSFERLSS